MEKINSKSLVTPNAEMRARLQQFIERHIHKTQLKAAKEMGVSQSALSYAINGQRPAAYKIWQILIEKYGLNIEWLTTGKGKERLDEKPEAKTLITDIRALNEKIAKLEVSQKILVANVDMLFRKIETMEKRLLTP